MTKKCPGCGVSRIDDSRTFCQRCERLELPGGEDLSSRALRKLGRAAAKHLSGSLRFKAQVLVGLLLTALAVIGVIDALVGFNLRDKMAQDFAKLEQDAKNRIEKQLRELDDSVRRTLAEVDVQMRSNVARNFESAVIQRTIQDVAKVEAKQLLEGEIRPTVNSFKEEAQFIRTVARAQAFDFKAYQQLLEVRQDTNENAKLAQQVLADIDRVLERSRSDLLPIRRFAESDGTNFYNGPFTSDDLATVWSLVSKDPTAMNREGFVNSVRELNQPLFLGVLITMFTNETDLLVADRIALAIADLSHADFHPRDYGKVQVWWRDRASSQTNWPVAELQVALSEFGLSHYPEAAKACEQVIALDGGADVSRAIAVVSYLEMGNTNRALALATGFKYPAARWAQLAAVRTELASGDIAKATAHLAALHSRDLLWIAPHRLRSNKAFAKVDWTLYDRLRSDKAR